MSTAVARTGSRALLQLPRRLLVGIRVDGTLGALHTTHGALRLRRRRHLAYLVATLRALRCHVALVVAAADAHVEAALRQQLRDCGLAVVVDQVAGKRAAMCHRTGEALLVCSCVNELTMPAAGAAAAHDTSYTPVAAQVCRCDLTDYFAQLARQLHTSPSRVVLVESELNYRFAPSQIVVVARHDAARAHGGDDSRLCGGDGAASRSMQRAVAEVARIAAHSNFLRRQHAPYGDASRMRRTALPPSSSTTTTTSTSLTRTSTEATCVDASPPPPPLPPPDDTLLALACLLTKLATSRADVTDFLRASSFVDTLRVPSYGSAFYLATERCPHMAMLDWSAIDVTESSSSATAGDVTH